MKLFKKKEDEQGGEAVTLEQVLEAYKTLSEGDKAAFKQKTVGEDKGQPANEQGKGGSNENTPPVKESESAPEAEDGKAAEATEPEISEEPEEKASEAEGPEQLPEEPPETEEGQAEQEQADALEARFAKIEEDNAKIFKMIDALSNAIDHKSFGASAEHTPEKSDEENEDDAIMRAYNPRGRYGRN